MASLNSFAHTILNRIKPYYTDDDNLDIREIKEAIHNQRALWVKKKIDRNSSYNIDQHEQDLGCLELEFVDAADCCSSSITTDCRVLRTVDELPRFINRFSKPLITRVAPVNKLRNMKVSLVPYNRVPYVGKGTFNGNVMFAFLLNSKMYLYQKNQTNVYKLLKYINVRGVLENPTDAASFTNCSGSVCYTDDDEYPMDRDLFSYFEDIIVGRYVNTLQIPVDEENDGKEELTQKIQAKQ